MIKYYIIGIITNVIQKKLELYCYNVPYFGICDCNRKRNRIFEEKERIPNDVCVLTIEDPAKNLGSGAATLNALLVAVEYLSAKQNYMVLSSDVLLQSRILIIHNGRDYLYTCTGKAFITLPEEYAPEDKSKPYSSSILSNLESVFQLLNKLSYESPFGVWVCSTDMLISQKKNYVRI
ncbi:l-fucose kinase [Caerostris extrusa]|uniref:L-fucose kinase n=1 Tax=Caerostris extrusa TaxID=172846 RepID=A0AAV4XSQ4_CAEEX|nr:l-fucose kinase [Caerostris extrusa]